MALYRDLQVVGWSQSLQVGCSFPGWHLELREHLCGSHWMRRFWTFSLRTGYWDLEKRWNPEAVTSWSGVPVGIKEGRSLKCVCFCVHWFPGELPSHYSEAALEFRLSPPSQGQTAQIEKQTWTSLGFNTNTHTQFGDRILSVTPEFGPSPPLAKCCEVSQAAPAQLQELSEAACVVPLLEVGAGPKDPSLTLCSCSN